MISTRWSTGNSYLQLQPAEPTPRLEALKPPQPLLERPAVLLGAALVTGIAIGMLVKWGFRR